jgi:hypothetical protein
MLYLQFELQQPVHVSQAQVLSHKRGRFDKTQKDRLAHQTLQVSGQHRTRHRRFKLKLNIKL